MAPRRDGTNPSPDYVSDRPRREHWQVQRHAELQEWVMDDGSYRYLVVVSDDGRPAFIEQWFSNPKKANNFLDRLMNNA